MTGNRLIGIPAAFLLFALLLTPPVWAEDFIGKDITGSDFGNQDFPFHDHNGEPRTLRDYRGKAILLFYGFLNCPNYCPTTLSKFKEAIDLLGEDGSQVQVIYITLDPERDTPARLKNYVQTFHPGFIGLYTPPESTGRMARAFKVYNQRIPGKAPSNYTIDHSLFAYAYDRNTRIRLLISDNISAEDVAADLRKLLKSD